MEVIERLCPRCHTLLDAEDESALIFCFHCGAPQVRLGQELRELAEAQISPAPADGSTHTAMPAVVQDPATVQWRPMLRITFAVSACLAIFALTLPPISLLVPAITLSLYASRFRQTRIDAGLGARIGLLCGLTMAAVAGSMSAVSSLFLRFRTHGMAAFDTALAAQFTQMRERMVAQQPDLAGSLGWMNVPEFRAGLMLAGFTMVGAVFLAAVTLSGALAGFARSRTTVRARL